MYMFYVIIAIMSMAVVFFCIRWLTLKAAVKKAADELKDISKEIEQNRIVKLDSPQKELEELISEMNHNLNIIRNERNHYEEKERNLKREIENISHDLRTPVTAILGYLEFINEDPMDEETKESLDIIRRKAGILRDLVVQFYDLSRITAGHMEMHLEKIDVGRKLREMAADSYQEMKKRNLSLDIEIPGHPISVLSDEAALERIFSNLFQNAGRYAKSRLAIKVSEDGSGAAILFANDTGQLTEEDTAHLFDRFYTGDNSRNQEGTGLGLPIAGHLVKAMGGEIYARLRNDRGEKWLDIHLHLI